MTTDTKLTWDEKVQLARAENERMKLPLIVDLWYSDISLLCERLNALSESDKRWFHPHEFDSAALTTLVNDGNHYYVLMLPTGLAGECAGYGMLRTKFGESRFDVPTLGMVIWPAYRGNGYGFALAALLLSKARRLGYRSVKLTVHPHNSVALSIYRALGFRETGKTVEDGRIWMEVKF